ncbi:CHAP domain-containing protein [Clostridioides difficile]|uniref:CHAP domain-containing protein n=1 Tax=Clostridioides difficile TaxID=1496 RepID=UPI0031B64DD8
MAKIKTRDAVKGTIKAIDKAAVASERMKAAYAKTKEKAEQGYYAEESSATEYAADKVSYASERIAGEGAHQLNRQGQKSVQTTKENIIKAKDKVEDFKEKRAVKTTEKQKAQAAAERNGSQPHHGAASRSPAPDTPANAGEKAKSRFIKTRQQGKQTIKTTARNAEKTVNATAQGTVKTKEAARAAAKGTAKSKDAARAAAKGTVKTAEKGIKTAQTTSKAAIKTTEQTAKAAKAAAKTSVKTAQKAAQAAKATAKATAHAIKVAVKATLAAIKAIIAGTKALIAAIMAGGWIAVAVILIICLIGLLVGSVFGIFFSGEDSGNGMTMQTVVREINADYDSRLDEIINNTSHDVLEMSGSRAVWKEVLAVYSVKTTTDPDNPQEVATMDDNKKQLLKDIFWEMNEISSRTESKTETQITESDDGYGNIVETEATVTQTYLYITVSHKTAEEMADKYGFNGEQRRKLLELLAEENNSLWSAVLYGITIGDGEIVTVALSQVGNAGGEPYWSWYGFDGRVEWCACFVSWCADQCGYIDSGVIPKFAGCVNGSQWFKDRGQWQDGGFTPEAGQIIFFDWEGDGETDHVGIVERCENGIVYTVEGNSGDACRQRSYPVGSRSIYGYGIPAY